LTTRGFVEADFVKVADFIDRGVQIAKQLKEQTPEPAKLKDFKALLQSKNFPEIDKLRGDVQEFTYSFPMPGQ